MMSGEISRRGFLQHLSKTVLTAAVYPGSFLVEPQWTDDGSPLPELAMPNHSSKPDLKTGDLCDGRLILKSSIHGEAYDFRFRDTKGNYDNNILTSLDWFFRCRDGTWLTMDVRTVELLNYLSKLLGDPLIQINSGYRSPSYNSSLRLGNENVARNSLHQYGRAVDISIPGMSIREVCSYALYARNVLGYGGIGYYPRSGFVHIDNGPVREWVR